MQTAIGIDIGATNIKGVVIDSGGKVLRSVSTPTEDARSEDQTGENWKSAVRRAVSELQDSLDRPTTLIGLAAPGIARHDNRAIMNMPGRMYGIEDFVWAEYLGYPQLPVLNDAHAALIAECVFGTGKGYQHVALLTLGTGVGGGLWLDGKLHQGFLQRGGHLGHLTSNGYDLFQGISRMPGSLEEAIGDISVSRRTYGQFATTHELVRAHEAGDPLATRCWLQSVHHLAIGICGIINAFAPELIILGGGICKAGDALFQPLMRFVDLFEWQPKGEKTPILEATFGDRAGAIGAAAYTMIHSHNKA